MNTVRVDSLKKNTSFSGDLFIDSTFMLLPKNGVVTEELIKALKEWDFTSVLCDGGLSLGDVTEIDQGGSKEAPNKRLKIGEIIKQIVEQARETSAENDEQARIEMVKKVYAEYMNYIEYIFTHYTTHKEIDQADLAEGIQDLCIFIKDHRRYVLRVNSSPDIRDKNFLVVHSMRSTVLAIAIAQQLHLSLSKMIELGITCLIHEIGMLQLPPQLYMKTKKLTPGERMQISKHTVFGYKIVKDLNFPNEVQVGVFEHHEKENGTGYPRKLTGDKISRNAKIISVACSYEAISSPRSYRDERSTFDALIEMIQNEDNKYDNRVLKALLYTVSLYPIGTYVFLSNRKVAVVIDSNPENPKEPIVQSLTEREPDGTLKTFKAGDDGITILRILSKDEKQDIIPTLKEKLKQEEEEIHAQQLKRQEENRRKAIEAGIIEDNSLSDGDETGAGAGMAAGGAGAGMAAGGDRTGSGAGMAAGGDGTGAGVGMAAGGDGAGMAAGGDGTGAGAGMAAGGDGTGAGAGMAAGGDGAGSGAGMAAGGDGTDKKEAPSLNSDGTVNVDISFFS